MEQKFKVGDRVRQLKHGCGTVEQVSPDNFRCHIKMDDDGQTINVLSDFMELIDATITPTANEPSRAMIAAMCLQGLLSRGGMWDSEVIVTDAVEAADALIAELQKPKP